MPYVHQASYLGNPLGGVDLSDMIDIDLDLTSIMDVPFSAAGLRFSALLSVALLQTEPVRAWYVSSVLQCICFISLQALNAGEHNSLEWFGACRVVGAHSRDDKGHDVNNDNHKCPTLFIPNSQALGSSTLVLFQLQSNGTSSFAIPPRTRIIMK